MNHLAQVAPPSVERRITAQDPSLQPGVSFGSSNRAPATKKVPSPQRAGRSWVVGMDTCAQLAPPSVERSRVPLSPTATRAALPPDTVCSGFVVPLTTAVQVAPPSVERMIVPPPPTATTLAPSPQTPESVLMVPLGTPDHV
ncbi:hypothetical protein [Longimicrobium sp.]|uniref:hypothetical protein n=1 Tax=Longimicrobium sp. TaxID=2029185 RepID=UPI003B3B1204